MPDTTDAMPVVGVYPRCSECQLAYVLRLCMRLSTATASLTSEWLWQRDCKHKGAAAELVE
jgi:hypothetical protein